MFNSFQSLMNQIDVARFEKISFEQFKKDYRSFNPDANDESIQSVYDSIKLPRRATTDSAGYDFYTPTGFRLHPNQNIKIPTGIKVKINPGWVLTIHMRSSVGFKYGIELSNTTGIIDGDYYNNENNEGHIWIKLTNNDRSVCQTYYAPQGEAICQGIFLQYGFAVDDNTSETRKGGFGSTNSQNN